MRCLRGEGSGCPCQNTDKEAGDGVHTISRYLGEGCGQGRTRRRGYFSVRRVPAQILGERRGGEGGLPLIIQVDSLSLARGCTRVRRRGVGCLSAVGFGVGVVFPLPV
ncbi:hypothetical protein LX36DRAFT_64793 [Colletotrichum falcatum]|nr:hypothetical protein LX36DRAFT_64793 [Colletotrichum falcatum]